MKWNIIAFLLFISVLADAQNNDIFVVGSISAKRGEKVSGKLQVEEGIDAGSFIPVTIIHGRNPGPVLTLNAGIHGTEYVPIIALQNIREAIDPVELSGTLVLVQVANVPSLFGRSIYSNPVDDKNLNRLFPGKNDGTFAERLAYTLTNEIIGKSDYYIDLHGGESNEKILNFTYFNYGDFDEDVCEKSKMLALAMGSKYLIPFQFKRKSDSLPSKYSDIEAMKRGIPAITVEIGDQGIVDPGILEMAESGILNVIKTIGMLEGECFINKHPTYLLDEVLIKSKSSGILYPMVQLKQSVSEGDMLGYTSDFFGNRLEEFRAPISGIVAKVFISPIVNEGESIYRLAKPVDEF